MFLALCNVRRSWKSTAAATPLPQFVVDLDSYPLLTPRIPDRRPYKNAWEYR